MSEMRCKYTRGAIVEAYEILQEMGDFNFPYDLKDKQLDVLENLMNGGHILAVLPTGFGKSDIFILAPLLLNIIDNKMSHISFVIVPLISLMMDIHKKFTQRGVRICQLRHNQSLQESEKQDLKAGKYSTILLTPECVADFRVLEDIFLENPRYTNGLCVIAIDEAHLLIQWGDKFRPAYRVMYELRSHFDEAPVLLTTATCPTDVRKRILDIMLFSNHNEVKTIALLPDRNNIALYYHTKCARDIEDALSWYLEEMEKNGENTRKAIIYCRSIRHTARGFGMLLYTLQQNAFKGGKMDFQNKLLAEYHAEVHDDDKERLLTEFSKPNSTIRCLISTVAFGIGIDIPDIHLIIHWGESDSVCQYWQEIGCGGRDEHLAEAHMYHLPMQLRQCQRDMHNFVGLIKSGECIRRADLNNLALDGMKVDLLPHPEQICCCNCTPLHTVTE